MVMLQQTFNSLAFLFFVPLVFVGAFFLLNLTLAVIKSKFTEEHNERKKRINRKGESPEEIRKKQEIERIKVERRIKPFIKKRLFSILDKVRNKLEAEEKVKYQLHRPMSIKGVLRRDLFDDNDDDDNEGLKSPAKLQKKTALINYAETPVTIQPKSIEEGNTQGKMEEESSYDMSSIDHTKRKVSSEGSKQEKSKTNSNDSSSGDDDKTPTPEDSKSPNQKQSHKSPYLSTLKIGGKNKWRNRLNISRETIVEVEEEHRSDTTNRMSTCKLMGSSDRKSSTRRFRKVLSTLKGNSPNSSLNMPPKDSSDISNPYYEGSPLLRDGHEFIKITLAPKTKKNSSKNVWKRLDDDVKEPPKSDRSVRHKKGKELITLSVGELFRRDDEEYVQKMNSNEVKLAPDLDDFLKDQEESRGKGDKRSDRTSSAHKTSEDELKSSEDCDYIDDLDSPISTDDDFYEDFFEADEYADSSLENINDTHIDRQYDSLIEEERKMSFNDSQSSYSSNYHDDFNNHRPNDVLSIDSNNVPKSFRTNIDNTHKYPASDLKPQTKKPKRRSKPPTNTSSKFKTLQSATRTPKSHSQIRRSETKVIDMDNKH